MAKHTQTIRWLLPANCLSVFDHFVELALKGLLISLASNPFYIFQLELDIVKLRDTLFLQHHRLMKM